jgi:hypothetical protein
MVTPAKEMVPDLPSAKAAKAPESQSAATAALLVATVVMGIDDEPAVAVTASIPPDNETLFPSNSASLKPVDASVTSPVKEASKSVAVLIVEFIAPIFAGLLSSPQATVIVLPPVSMVAPNASAAVADFANTIV